MGQCSQRRADPLARVEVPVRAKGTLLLAHPAQQLDVPRTAAGQAIGDSQHGHLVAGVVDAAEGQQVDAE